MCNCAVAQITGRLLHKHLIDLHFHARLVLGLQSRFEIRCGGNPELGADEDHAIALSTGEVEQHGVIAFEGGEDRFEFVEFGEVLFFLQVDVDQGGVGDAADAGGEHGDFAVVPFFDFAFDEQQRLRLENVGRKFLEDFAIDDDFEFAEEVFHVDDAEEFVGFGEFLFDAGCEAAQDDGGAVGGFGDVAEGMGGEQAEAVGHAV
jgi:hypothetical protein